jgi:hypothetical protein
MSSVRGICNRALAIAVAALTPAAIWPYSAQAVDLVGIAQSAALDQPRINLMLSTAPGSPLLTERVDLEDIFGPPIQTVNLQAYFDTGASGILLGNFTATDLGVPRATHNGQPVKFHDVGVAGSDEFDVSELLYVGLAPFQPFTNVDSVASYTQLSMPMRMQVGPIRQITNPSNDPIDQLIFLLTNQEFNVVGMPAMTGKTVVIDSRHTNNAANILGGDPDVLDDIINGGDIGALASFLNSLELRTYVYNPGTPFAPATVDTNPGIPEVSHHIKLSYGTFDGYTTVTPAGAAGPTLAHNPFVGPNPVLNNPSDTTPPVKIGLGNLATEGSFLFDTGAAASMISTELAADLHVRYVAGTKGTENAALELFNPANGQSIMQLPDQFKLTIGGIGGQTTLAGFFLDELLLKTIEGNAANDDDPNHMKFLGAPVLVHDIVLHHPDPNQTITLDGILGMNFLTGSVNVTTTGTEIVGAGYTAGAFDWLTFDETTGMLGLKLNSAFVPIAGDFDSDGDVDGADFVAWQTNFPKASGATLGEGDADGDGDVDGADFVVWQTHFPYTPGGGASPVPEPQAILLATLALVGWMAARRSGFPA